MGTDIHGVFQRRTENGWVDVPSLYEEDRHYQLFAVLAGVRNGYGFAGCPTGEAVTPIAEPRGLPADFEVDDEDHPIQSLDQLPEWRRKYRSAGEPLTVWMGDHSHSWLTGAEILAWAEKAPEIMQTGIIAREKYEAWDGSQPDAYCGGISGPAIVVINDNAVEKQQTPAWTHIRVTWQTPLKKELADFFGEVARLVAEHGEVRFVFGFDS